MPPDDNTATEQQLDDLALAESGDPVTFEIAGRRFSLVQPTPADYERLRMVEGAAYRRALADPELADLHDTPEAIDTRLQRSFQIGYMTAQIEYEHGDRRKELDADLRELELTNAVNGNSGAQDVALDIMRRRRDKWVIDHFLRDGDGEELSDDDRAKLDASPAFFEACRPQVWRVLSLLNTLPKFD